MTMVFDRCLCARGLVTLIVAMLAGAALASAAPTGSVAVSDPIFFEGACDGSAAMRLDEDVILVASDNSNVLHEYSFAGGAPTASHDLYGFLGVMQRPAGARSRLEGFARIGDQLYVIGSHARDQRGVTRPDHRLLFALKVESREGREVVRPHGEPNADLVRAIEEAESLRTTGLSHSILSLHVQLAHLAPEKRGLSIGALGVAPDGKGLLIGLRGPTSGRRSLILPVDNPENLVLDFPAAPQFGEPIRLDLGGLGIVGIERAEKLGGYLLLAAPKDVKQPGSKLYAWTGAPDDAAVEVHAFEGGDFSPEALVPAKDGRAFLALSDDGHRPVPVESPELCRGKRPGTTECNCNMLLDQSLGRFHGHWITFPEATPPAAPARP